MIVARLLDRDLLLREWLIPPASLVFATALATTSSNASVSPWQAGSVLFSCDSKLSLSLFFWKWLSSSAVFSSAEALLNSASESEGSVFSMSKND